MALANMGASGGVKDSTAQTIQTALQTLAKEDGGNLAAILAALASVAVTGPLTDAQLRATPVPMYQLSGAVVDTSGNVLPVKHALANVAASQTDASVVAAVALKKIRVLSVFALAGGTATNLTFNTKGAGAGVAISPLLANGANGGEVLGRNVDGWFETSAGEALTVTTGTGSTTGIGVNYVEVT